VHPFPVVLPVGIPAGVRVTTISVSPVRNPSLVSVHYEGGVSKVRAFDRRRAAIVDSQGAPVRTLQGRRRRLPSIGPRPGSGLSFRRPERTRGRPRQKRRWPRPHQPTASRRRNRCCPSSSCSGRPCGWCSRAVSPRDGSSVLVGQNGLRGLQRLIAQGKPLADDRTWTITQLVYANNDIKSAVMRKSTTSRSGERRARHRCRVATRRRGIERDRLRLRGAVP